MALVKTSSRFLMDFIKRQIPKRNMAHHSTTGGIPGEVSAFPILMVWLILNVSDPPF